MQGRAAVENTTLDGEGGTTRASSLYREGMANAAGGSRIRERPWAEDFEVESTRPASRPWYKKCVDSCKIFCLKLSGKKTVETMCPKCGALVLGEPYQRVDCPECALDFTCPKDSHTPARMDAELIWGNNTESDATLVEIKRGQLEQNAQESEPESINHDHLHPPPVSKVIDETRKRKSPHDEKRKSADVNPKVLSHRLFGVQSVGEFEAGEADGGQGVGSAVHGVGGKEGKHSQELLLLSGSSEGVRRKTKKSTRNIVVGRRRTSSSTLRAKAEGEAVEGGLYLTDEDGESGVDTEVGSREGVADWTSGVDPGAHRRLGREQITMVDGFLKFGYVDRGDRLGIGDRSSTSIDSSHNREGTADLLPARSAKPRWKDAQAPTQTSVRSQKRGDRTSGGSSKSKRVAQQATTVVPRRQGSLFNTKQSGNMVLATNANAYPIIRNIENVENG